MPPAAHPPWLHGALGAIPASQELFPAPHTPWMWCQGEPASSAALPAWALQHPFTAAGVICSPAGQTAVEVSPGQTAVEVSPGQTAVEVCPGQLSPPRVLPKSQPHPLGHTFISSSALKELHGAKRSCAGPGVNPEYPRGELDPLWGSSRVWDWQLSQEQQQ